MIGGRQCYFLNLLIFLYHYLLEVPLLCYFTKTILYHLREGATPISWVNLALSCGVAANLTALAFVIAIFGFQSFRLDGQNGPQQVSPPNIEFSWVFGKLYIVLMSSLRDGGVAQPVAQMNIGIVLLLATAWEIWAEIFRHIYLDYGFTKWRLFGNTILLLIVALCAMKLDLAEELAVILAPLLSRCIIVWHKEKLERILI